MTIPRWMPLFALAMVVIVGVTVAVLWSQGKLNSARDDTGGKPPIPACDPAIPSGQQRPAECPQSTSPSTQEP